MRFRARASPTNIKIRCKVERFKQSLQDQDSSNILLKPALIHNFYLKNQILMKILWNRRASIIPSRIEYLSTSSLKQAEASFLKLVSL